MDRRRLWNACALAAALLCLTGCPPLPPPTGGPDTTPPGFLNVDVKVEPRVGSPQQPPGAISIISGDVTKQISRANRIRLIANVGDSESGIASLALATVSANDGQGVLKSYNLSFTCRKTAPQVGILELGTLTTTPAIVPIATPASLTSIEVTIDPVAQAAAGCGNGTTSLSGFVRLVATNGKGATSTSGTFLFEFVP